MMMAIAGIIGALGIVCLIVRRSLLGLLIGVQILTLGSTMIFVLAGLFSNNRIQGHVLGLFITLGGIAQLVLGCSLAIRIFFLRKRISVDELKGLRR